MVHVYFLLEEDVQLPNAEYSLVALFETGVHKSRLLDMCPWWPTPTYVKQYIVLIITKRVILK